MALTTKTISRKNQPRVNNEIKANKIRLISDDGTQLGMKTLEEALKLARLAGHDLVQLTANNDGVAVCKIMDFGKFKYRQAKMEKKQRVQTRAQVLKMIRLGFATAQHDLEIKAGRAKKFLKKGHRVKIQLMFKGREITHFDLGIQKLKDFAKMLDDVAKIDEHPKKMGRSIVMTLSPIQ